MRWKRVQRPGNDRCDYVSGGWSIRPTYTQARRVGCPNQHNGWQVWHNGNRLVMRGTLAEAKKWIKRNLEVEPIE